MTHLDKLKNESIYIIREAYYQFNRQIAMLWSIGKDSTTLLWLCRKAFFGKIPFPILHIDTSYKFKEIYQFRDKYTKIWNLDLQIIRNEKDLNISPKDGKFQCCNLLKTEPLKQVISQRKFKALLLGIRRDEHGIRAKERIFSLRNEAFQWNYKNQAIELWNQYSIKTTEEEHIRIHPLLGWTEIDIWNYIKKENIPITTLYFAKNNKRYRSIGCSCCCKPVNSQANTITKIIKELQITKISERSGRAQDKEDTYTMQRLRSLGYM